MNKCKECGQEIPGPVVLVAFNYDSEVRPIPHRVSSYPGSRDYIEAGITLARYLYGVMAGGQLDSFIYEINHLNRLGYTDD